MRRFLCLTLAASTSLLTLWLSVAMGAPGKTYTVAPNEREAATPGERATRGGVATAGEATPDEATTPDQETPPTLDDIVTWSEEGWTDDEIVAEIAITDARYDVDARALLRLGRQGVSDAVLVAMVRTDVAEAHAADLARVARDWDAVQDRPVVQVVRPWPRHGYSYWHGRRRWHHPHHGGWWNQGYWPHGGSYYWPHGGGYWPHAW